MNMRAMDHLQKW